MNGLFNHMSYVICEILFLAKDATKAFEMQHHSDEARELMKSFYVGQYLDVRTMQTFNSISNLLV